MSRWPPTSFRRLAIAGGLSLLIVAPAVIAAGGDLLSGPAVAGDESAPPSELDRLFLALGAADTPQAAQRLEQAIWTIWLRYDGEAMAVRGMMRRGSVAVGQRRLADAESAFDEVIALDPDYAEGWNRRATVRFLRGDLIGSVADIRAALAREPRHFAALSGLGLAYMALDEDALALAAFEAALAIHPFMEGARRHADFLRQRLAGRPI